MSRLAFAPEERRRLVRRGLLLLLGAATSAGVVAALGMGFEEAESRYAMQRQLERLDSEASLLAVELGHELSAHGPDPRTAAAAAAPIDPARGALVDLVEAADCLESPDEHVFLRPPGTAGFVDLHGAPTRSPALDRLGHDASAVLPAEDAVLLGLPDYPAMVSVAAAEGGPLGTWRVAIARTTRLEVERDLRGMLRVVIKVTVTSAIVALFGYLAFRDFRAEILARHELALAEQRRSGEAVLARESRTATMLTLATGVAHEVGTPLGLVQLKAEALRDALADTPEEADARTILAQVYRLREVVQGFLRVARGRAPDQVSLDPVGLAHTVEALVQHRFEAADVKLAVEIGADVPRLRANRLLVEHALANLLVNACDASPPGSSVRLRVRRDGDAACFEVLDEGEGVAEEDQELLLEPFFSRKEHGTGLGLAITREIARMHHGDVSLRPRTPRGAVATLRLPEEAT